MKRIYNWKSFNEAQSYPEPIEFYVESVIEKSMELFDEYLSSDEEDLQETFTIDFTQILPHIKKSPELFKRFPVETLEVSLNLISSTPFNFKGVSKRILDDEEQAEKYGVSYFTRSKSDVVDKAIFYRIALAVGVDKGDQDDIKYAKELLTDITNHEIQHGYDEFTRLTKNIDVKSDYVFYNSVMMVSEVLGQHLDFDENPALALFLISIYNCSETEIKSALVEPGKNIKSVEDWKRILSKRHMNYDYSNLLEDLKKDANWEAFDAIPQLILDQYLEVCEVNDIKPDSKLVKVCQRNFEDFAKYWIEVIKQKVNKIKRKSAKRIQISK